jgi:ABC-type antimicrobial peptide transport system permease subunit
VISLVMGEGAGLIGAGAGVGLLGTFWLTQFLRKQLFEVSPADPMVLATVTAVLAGVALLACWLPARRAAKVDPVVALRTE